MSSIRIIKVPQGLAPEWVRKEWVGVEISLTEPTNNFATDYPGFEVSIDTALKELDKKNVSAANWFRLHLPTLQGNFKFREEECEYLP